LCSRQVADVVLKGALTYQCFFSEEESLLMNVPEDSGLDCVLSGVFLYASRRVLHLD
jgi:hypothetical protein